MTTFTGTATVRDKVTGLTATASAPFTVASATTVAAHVGAMVSPATSCPSSVSDWLGLGQATFGGLLRASKMFYSGTQQMTTWGAGHLRTDSESALPPGVLLVVTYRDAQIPSLPAYVESIPADREVWLAYAQEAEDWYPGGDYAAFKATTIRCSMAIRAVGHPNVKVLQNCAGSKYGVAGSTAQQGLWAADPAWVDVYSIDCYQNQAAGKWPTQGLANYPEFQNWLSVYAGRGRPLAITEYGLNACSGNAARNARLQQDCAYLRKAFGGGPGAVSPFPLAAWLYWYSNCTSDTIGADCTTQHQFTDAATISTWKAICAGTL